MANTFVKILGWEVRNDSIFVSFNTWDGKCICTRQKHSETLVNIESSKPLVDLDKKDIHLLVLEALKLTK